MIEKNKNTERILEERENTIDHKEEELKER